jgi:hypothetical protein
VKLFKQFLDQEQCVITLDFWFACEGLKMQEDPEKIHNLAKLIYKKFVKDQKVGEQIRLPEDVRKELGERMKKPERTDRTMFNGAQTEVEDMMRNDSYPLFLKSDIYVAYVQAGGESPKTSNASSGSSSVRPLSQGPLPTLREEEELTNEDIKQRTTNLTLPLTPSLLIATATSRMRAPPTSSIPRARSEG